MSDFQVSELYVGSRNDDPKAPLFVLLHGFGGSIFQWRDLTEPLSQLGEIFAYDRPGFGDTDRPTKWQGTNPYSVSGNLEFLERRLTQIKRDRPIILIGHSAGGQIATYFAATHPLMVQGLILISPAMNAAGVPESFSKLFANKFFDRVGPKLVKSFDKAGMQLLYKSVHDLNFLTPEVIAGYRDPLKHPDWTIGFWQFMKTPQPRDQHNAIAKVNCPTLVITGDDDRVVPTKGTLKLVDEYRDHKLVVIPNGGHISHEEHPEVFMAAVRANLTWLLGN
ncbi:MAG: alpha/beta fold hydrolase [Micrococcales bacterium]